MGTANVVDHYTHGGLLAAIERGIALLGKTTATVSVDDLAPVDEFHIGGRAASIAFLDQLELHEGLTVLDVGCGIGGASRFAAQRYGVHVTGLDLTPEYIHAGRSLCAWLGLDRKIDSHIGSATQMPFQDGEFDRAYMMHVGMNIPDKNSLCAEVARVLRPGGIFGIYDVMRRGSDQLLFPVPWAATVATSAVVPPQTYRDALGAAGFVLEKERDRHAFALQFFEELKAKVSAKGGPPPLGLHILMGESAPLKVKNMLENLAAGRITPVEMIARKR